MPVPETITLLVSTKGRNTTRADLTDRVGADSLVSRLNTGQRINLGDYDMRQHLVYTHTPND